MPQLGNHSMYQAYPLTVTKTGAKSMGVRIVSNDPTNPDRYIWVKAQFPEKYEYKCPTCP